MRNPTPGSIPSALTHLNAVQVFDVLSYFRDHMDEIREHVAQNRVSDELKYRGPGAVLPDGTVEER